MPEAPPSAAQLTHRWRRLTGRDPWEHRGATPLELLLDLTFVVAFGFTADQTAHYAAEGMWGVALGGFVVSVVASSWAWINFTWFSSAFDNDDWLSRVLTMLEMVGVLVFALGIAPMFASLADGTGVLTGVLLAGYIVMRLALCLQWLRAAIQARAERRVALTYVVGIAVAQLGWLAILLWPAMPTPVLVAVIVLALAFDFGTPVIAELREGGIPWNAHHTAERFSLLAIIALGEMVFGTIAAVAAVVDRQGWSSQAVLLVAAGTGLTLGMWWIYFLVPSGIALQYRRHLGKFWSYFHILIFGAIAATGAGLHVAAYVIDGSAHVAPWEATAATTVPVLVFILSVFVLYTVLVGSVDPFHIALVGGAAVLLVTAPIVAASADAIGVSLAVAAAAPVVVIVGYETVGYRHESQALQLLAAKWGGPS